MILDELGRFKSLVKLNWENDIARILPEGGNTARDAKGDQDSRSWEPQNADGWQKVQRSRSSRHKRLQ